MLACTACTARRHLAWLSPSLSACASCCVPIPSVVLWTLADVGVAVAGRIEHLERVSARDAGAVLLLHPEVSEGGDGSDGDGSSDDGAENGAAVAASNGSDNPGAAALKLQTMMALSGQLLGSKAKVVVQVGAGGSDQSRLLHCGNAQHLLTCKHGLHDSHPGTSSRPEQLNLSRPVVAAAP
jgi:hypothetical protein